MCPTNVIQTMLEKESNSGVLIPTENRFAHIINPYIMYIVSFL